MDLGSSAGYLFDGKIPMVWLLEKKVVRHFVDLGFERVEIPIRVKFEFEVKEGVLIPDTLSFQTLYNKKALQNRYPRLNLASLENAIETTVNEDILEHIKECGFLKDESASDVCQTSPNPT